MRLPFKQPKSSVCSWVLIALSMEVLPRMMPAGNARSDAVKNLMASRIAPGANRPDAPTSGPQSLASLSLQFGAGEQTPVIAMNFGRLAAANA